MSVPLRRYVDVVAGELPTRQQKENFVDYVSHAHSWYKHLSAYPPGTAFFFFMNRYAGYDRRHGTAEVRERSEPGFHYAQIPTDLYRAAFGCLDYTRSGDTVPLVDEGPVLVYGLPAEVLQSGVVRLTGVIHTLSAANFWVWDEDRRPDSIVWPEESGGRATLEMIFHRWRESQKPGFRREETTIDPGARRGYPASAGHVFLTDPVLYELLAPERRRQQVEMIKAIDRVCEVIERERRRD